ncbi:MAG TPA: TetR/AcrR family transcriptional regulator [Gemmatimonadales bacterium]
MVNPAGTRGQATRTRLLAAALDGFVSRGYHGTTTAFLAERTGIAEGTIYRHYRGKDALYSAVALQAWEQAAAAVLEEPASRVSARERLAHAGRRLVREAAAAPLVIRFVLGDQERDRLDEPARRAADRFREAVVQLVASGKQEGAVRPGTAELWAAVWIAVVSAVCERVARGEWAADHANVELALDAAWSAIGS